MSYTVISCNIKTHQHGSLMCLSTF